MWCFGIPCQTLGSCRFLARLPLQTFSHLRVPRVVLVRVCVRLREIVLVQRGSRGSHANPVHRAFLVLIARLVHLIVRSVMTDLVANSIASYFG